jgi:predicted RNA binding protein with dsRBD fold (UPF0201 family)
VSQVNVRAKITLEATVSPSEDSAKVVGALERVLGEPTGKLFSDSRIARLVTDEPKALLHIRDQLRDRHVRSTARRRLLLDRKGHSTLLMLNRQAATAGVLAICGGPEESPLGPIYMKIESRELEGVTDFLTSY